MKRTRCPRIPEAIVAAILVLLALPPVASAQIEASGPDPTRPWAASADGLLADGKLEEAERAYVALTAEHGEDPGLWTRIAYTRLSLRRLESAMEAAVRASELGPDDVEALMIRAQCEAAAGDREAAATTLQRGLEIAPEDPLLLESMISTFISLERWAEAVGLLRELIRVQPDQPEYYMDLGRILLTTGQFAEAVGSFGQARAQGADAALALALTGKAHLAAGQWDQAMLEFDESISLRPNADAHGGRATIHYLQGDPESAIEEFRRALEFAPRDPDLHFNLGNMLVQTGDGAAAEKAYREALALDETIGEAHVNLGILLMNRFEIAAAEQHLRRATELDATLASPWLHLARIAGARFQFEESRRNYQTYAERVEQPQERARVAGVLARLEAKVAESRAAVGRGEVHLLQARFDDEERARELIAAVRRGGDFFLLAGELSDLGEVSGVDAGFMDPAGAQPAIRDAVGGLEIGEMTSPVELGGKWFVFMRVE